MEEKMSATLESIQRAAMQEFLDKGFQGASLRQIVKNAGVTTGAFYGYYASKEELFEAQAQENDQYESMKKRIKYMYENGNTKF